MSDRPQRGSGCARSFGVGCLVVALALIVLIGYSLWSRPKPPVLTPAERAEARAQISSLRDQIRQIRHDAAAGVSRSFALRVSDREVNTMLQEDEQARAALSQRKLRDVFVRIGHGELDCYGTRQVRGIPVGITAKVVPEVSSDGSLNLQLREAGLGPIGLNESTAQRIAARLTQVVSSRLMAKGITLGAARVEGNALVLEGSTGAANSGNR